MSDEMLLQRVRTQAILGMKLNKGGSTLSFRVETRGRARRAAFKTCADRLADHPAQGSGGLPAQPAAGLGCGAAAAPRMVSREEIFRNLHPDSLAALPRIRAETVFNPTGRTAGVGHVLGAGDQGLGVGHARRQSIRACSG